MKINVEEERLKQQVKEIFSFSKKSYGSRRILSELQSEGKKIGRYKVRSLMKRLDLKARTPKRYKVTTDSKHSYKVAPNILDRKFSVDKPNSVWTTDLTYIWTLEGWMYLAVVLDLCSRQVVGWDMGKRMDADLVKNALAMAYWRRKPEAGLLHHSDRGSQYACHSYQKLLNQFRMLPSMSRKGDCWDNAPTERFFRSLKSERLNYCRFVSRYTAKAEVLDYITFYNAYRRHSTLDYLSPMEFERKYVGRAA
jgi:transposase InsO family protein